MKVKVERMAPEGQALTKSEDGKIVFVDYGAPGDVLDVRLGKNHARYALGHPLEIIKNGPGRIVPQCPYHFNVLEKQSVYCGGCNWQHLGYQTQLEWKTNIVKDALERIGKFDNLKLHSTLPSPQVWRYRNKVQVPFRQGQDGAVCAGFYMPGTHNVVDFDDCLVQPEISVKIIQAVKNLCSEYGWLPYDEEKQRGWLRHLLIRTNHLGEALLIFITRTADFPHVDRISLLTQAVPGIIGIHQNIQQKDTSVILGEQWIKIWGSDYIMEKIGDLSFRVSPGSFFQVNIPACEILYKTVKDFLNSGETPGNVLDLYCGVGTLDLWLAVNGIDDVGIEEYPQAVEDARWNAESMGIKNAKFICGRVEDEIIKYLNENSAVVLDPPRTGCDEKVINALGRKRANRIVYVSCNPATFARDARRLAKFGYSLKEVQPVDLFPQTSHVELSALFVG